MPAMNEIRQNARICAKTVLAENIYRLSFETALCSDAVPGQFVMVYPPDNSSLLGRPLCIEDASGQDFSIVFRAVGYGTRAIASCEIGKELAVAGPFGNGYPTDDKTTEGKNIALLGGGLGIPSLYYLAKKLCTHKSRITAILGYRDSSMKHFLLDDFAALGINTLYTTDDGSDGLHGNVLDVLKSERIPTDLIYACGPMPMLSAVKSHASEINIPAYISLEEHMACGAGVCLGCVVKTELVDAHSNVTNARVCTEGPVFEADKVQI